jgi:hypothetical protein
MVFEFLHNSLFECLLGVFKTIQKIRAHFIWKGVDNDIHARWRACRDCVLSKPAQQSTPGLLASEVATRPIQKIFIDCVGKFPRSKSGNTMILVCVDEFSKFAWLIAVREASTSATIMALKKRVFFKFFGASNSGIGQCAVFHIALVQAVLLQFRDQKRDYNALLPSAVSR